MTVCTAAVNTLATLARNVASTPSEQRHQTLLNSAISAGGYVQSECLTWDHAYDVLRQAGIDSGHDHGDHKHIEGDVKDGLTMGMERGPGPGHAEYCGQNVAKVTLGPVAATSLEDCVATFRKFMHLPDPGSVYVSLATIIANRGDGDPIWTLLVGGPSSGKTEPVLTLRGEPDCHLSGPITEAALLSGTPRKEAQGSKGGLLREIGDFGILLVKDFTSVLSMYRDTRAALLAALREIYDGTWTRHVGTDGGRTLQWDGKLGLLGCVTGAIDSAHSVMATMGERFVLYRIPESDESKQSRIALGRSDGRQMRLELTAAMRGALASASERPTRSLTPPETDFLVALSQLVARGRSTVDRDGYSREINLVYAPEGPARVALVLKEMLLALERLGLPPKQTYDIVRKLGLDSIPDLRRKVLEHLLTVESEQTTSAIAVAVDHPTKTTHRTLEDLAAHRLIARTSQGHGKADLWQAGSLAVELWSKISETETQGTYGESAVRQGLSPSLKSPLPVLVDISVSPSDSEFEDFDYLAAAIEAGE